MLKVYGLICRYVGCTTQDRCVCVCVVISLIHCTYTTYVNAYLLQNTNRNQEIIRDFSSDVECTPVALQLRY